MKAEIMTSDTGSGFKSWWIKNDLWVLLALYFFSLPIGKTLWLPLIVMSVSGIYLFLKGLRQKALVENTGKLLVIAACFFLPALNSLPDSLVTSRTLQYLGTYPLFVGVGYFILIRMKSVFDLSKLLNSIALITILWSICAFWQFLLPNNNPFPAAVGGRYQGVFGQSDMVLGYVLAAVIPFLLFGYWYQGKRTISLFVSMFLIGTCLISGNRASWVSIIFMLFALPVVALLMGYRIRVKYLSLLIIAVILSGFFGANLIEGTAVKSRLDFTLEFFKNPSFDSFDGSSAGRGEIWSTSVIIGLENPFNGTGVGNFRYAHPYYAPADTIFRFPNSDQTSPHKFTGAMYPHQMVLQQFAGAGWPGLIGMCLFYILLLKFSWDAVKYRNLLGVGAVLAVWMGFFPLNTHLNFHGGWLTGNFWVWIGVLLGCCYRLKDGASPPLSRKG